MKIKEVHFKLHTRIALLVCGVVALVLIVTNIFISKKITDMTREHLEEKAFDIAHIVSQSPTIIDGLNNPQHESKIQYLANKMKDSTSVQFIVVTDMKGIRKSHPDKIELGKKAIGGDFGKAFQGNEYVSEAQGTLGKSLRIFVPIRDNNSHQIGVVVVGIAMDKVQQSVIQSRHTIYFGIVFGFLTGVVGAVLLANNIKKTMFGMEPSDIAKLLRERSAMLKSVREGILAVDKHGIITLVNDEAARIFDKADIRKVVGKKVDDCVDNTRLIQVLKSGQSELDREQELKGITLITNRIPIVVNNKIDGAIATFRDKTEVKILAEQLTGVKSYASSLRAQTHEFMNKLHVILGMLSMKSYDELSEYIQTIANKYQKEIGFVIRHFKDPVLSGFILGKMSYAREKNVSLVLSEDSYVPEPSNKGITHELITVVGNLIDNAIDAVSISEDKIIYVSLVPDDDRLHITVSDTGNGFDDKNKNEIFKKGFSTKKGSRGFGLYLVKRSIEKLAGRIDVYSKINEGTTFDVELNYERKGDII
ncbi:DcuS/MalK family sensor histidine kinase [Clostridium ljungdahlii]|uniref:histidine kinase n=1 Tax=Clostridium ljungdahlii TaxID=1538 RepID=A0A168NS67_9CLOT|nr:DcuS/MalK family sensor histidine kinase [Clostridium ljungdahlii]OAA86834.1 Sensor histidine kinase DcuS [Clostridium ljungdahlii]